MSRTWIGAAVLVLMLVGGILFGGEMDRRNGELAEQLEEAARQAVAGNLTGAIELTEDIRVRWEEGWNFCAALTDHEPLEQIDGGFARLELYGAVGNAQEFAVTCVELAKQVESIGDAHGAQWWNIL